MVTETKSVKSNKTSAAGNEAVKQTAEITDTDPNALANKPALKPEIKRATVNKNPTNSLVIKKAVVSMKKISARPIPKKKVAARVSPVVSRTRQLRVLVAALKQEIRNLKNELKIAKKRADAVASMREERDAAVARFLKSWDKKATLSLEKSLKAMKNKKSRK